MFVLDRTYYPDRTEGELWAYHNRSFKTLELPWKENARNISCIPEGRYRLLPDETGHHRWFRFRDVETSPRSAIEIHPASQVGHLQGCIGMSRNDCEALKAMCPAGDWIWIRSEGGEPPMTREVET